MIEYVVPTLGALADKHRLQVVDLLTQNPTMTRQQIAKTLQISPTELFYDLQVLLKSNIIRVTERPGHTKHYAIDSITLARVLSVLKSCFRLEV